MAKVPAKTPAPASKPSAKLKQPPVPKASVKIAALAPFRAAPDAQTLTTNQGVPVADNQNSLKAGLRGPALLEDFERAALGRAEAEPRRDRVDVGSHQGSSVKRRCCPVGGGAAGSASTARL